MKENDVRKEGWFAIVGDLVREGWCYKTRSIAAPYTYGIVVQTYPRSPDAYTPKQIAEKPIRMVDIFTTDGRKIRRYTVHVEIVNEGR